jgi:hypothetical protein
MKEFHLNQDEIIFLKKEVKEKSEIKEDARVISLILIGFFIGLVAAAIIQK